MGGEVKDNEQDRCNCLIESIYLKFLCILYVIVINMYHRSAEATYCHYLYLLFVFALLLVHLCKLNTFIVCGLRIRIKTYPK